MKKSSPDSFTKITKVSLVIYCFISLVSLIIFLSISATLKKYNLLWGFLLCLGPSIIFILVSLLLPFEKVIVKGTSKGTIVWFSIAQALKYVLIFAIPIVGIYHQNYFNKWVMLGVTFFTPIYAMICKILIANIVSKNNKNNEEKPKNTIKF